MSNRKRAFVPLGLAWLAAAALTVAVVLPAAANEGVQLKSTALTTIADVMGGKSVSDTVPVTGTLIMPPGAGSSPVPAMIIVPDATSLDDGGRVDYWAQVMLGMGVAVFIPDSFGSRGVEKSENAQRTVTPDMRIADAFAALMALGADPRIDHNRIGIMGSGAGGSVAVHTAFGPVQRALTQRNRRFRVHIALYPACDAQWQIIDPTGAPIHFLLAGQSKLHSAERCQIYAERIGTAGGTVTTATYPQAFYGFDSDWERKNIGGLSSLNKCLFRITDAGNLVEVNSGVSSGTAEGRNEITKTCTTYGAVVSKNNAVRESATERVRHFVTESLLR